MATDADKPQQDDRQAIIGYWKLVAVVQDDLQFEYCDIGTITEITPERIRHLRTGCSYEYDLHPEESPRALDLYISRADNFYIKGIYELAGDELRTLYNGLLHDVRPTSMTGIRGDTYLTVHVYRRSRWRPPKQAKPKKPVELCAPGSLIPKGFLSDL